MPKYTASYICSNCNASSYKWSGKCLQCGSWGTVSEIPQESFALQSKTALSKKTSSASFQPLEGEFIKQPPRIKTSVTEFDRACGGGLVKDVALLVGGDPGIGKSTLLLQIANYIASSNNCYYVSGEESLGQLAQRASRLNLKNKNIKFSTSSSVDSIIATLEKEQDVNVVIIDSIQTVYMENIDSSPGSVSQVKNSANALIKYAKNKGFALILVGHVTRDGQIAGPKVLEHLVDTVLYFEGDKNNHFRILRAIKNRFGPTDEIGIFEMTSQGLLEVSNPSSMFLNDYNSNISGTAVFAGLEGSRPMLIEIQCLLLDSVYASPKRAIIGTDANRISMLTAVLESRNNVCFSGSDIYINVAGGLKINEPASDLAVAAALVSSAYNKPLPQYTAFVGEVSLSGQVRNVSLIEKRLSEAHRLGFKNIFIPPLTKENEKLIKKYPNLNIECTPSLQHLIGKINE